MTVTPVETSALTQQTIATVQRWLDESRTVARDRSARRLANVLTDPRGLDFAIGFMDRVVRPEELRLAGHNLEKLSREVPAFLPLSLRIAIQFAGGFAPIMPWPIVPIARRVLRGVVGHLVLDCTPKKFNKKVAELRRAGIRPNITLLGEAVLGDNEADRRLKRARELLQHDEVDYLSITVSSVTSQLSTWSFDETVARVVGRLTPLFELASLSVGPKFITLDVEQFRDLGLTMAVFTRTLDQPQLTSLEAGIVLPANLPDALGALQSLTTWATKRRAAGGSSITVRLATGANLAMEHVDAALHGWPLASYASMVETGTNYMRVLNWAFTPDHTDAVRIGIAGQNLFDIAYAWLLAKERRVESSVEYEVLLGTASGQADAVTRDIGGLLLSTPVVRPNEFDSAISYLVRRFEENARSENVTAAAFERERDRFLASLDGLNDSIPTSHRVQDRSLADAVLPVATAPRPFSNTAETDPAVAVNRSWGRKIVIRVPSSTLGIDLIAAAGVDSDETLDAIITGTARAGAQWGQRRADTRAAVLHAAGESLAACRADLIEVMASETGMTLADGDVEVNAAVDCAHFYAESARELDRVGNALFLPSQLIVVTPPSNSPVAIPAGSVLAALAAGAGVIIKPAPQAKRSAAVLVNALWEGGVPRDILRLVDIEEGGLSERLIAHPAVDRVILAGSWETAKLFRSWRADLALLAQTSGKNAIVVTPSADLDLAVADIVTSAFGHAGQKCSAASLVILVGSMATSERFRRQLVDSVTTLRVGWPQDPTAVMGPIIERAAHKLATALTTLGVGESWLVKPKKLDESGRLWSPGVRDNVQPGSEFHLTEYLEPVLGVMTAATLDEAIALQNAPAYGLAAGIHSLDPGEIRLWLDTVEAGNLAVNRGTTSAVVRRQPFGGWKRSTVGASAKSGGPNYLLTLGDWSPIFTAPGTAVVLRGLSVGVTRVIEAAQPGMEFLEFDQVRAAAESDEAAWASDYGVSHDVAALGIERNVFRYRPVPVTIRLAEGASPSQLVRCLVAATRARATVTVSSAVPVHVGLISLLRSEQTPLKVLDVVVETDSRFQSTLRDAPSRPSRIRLLGGDHLQLAEALDGDPDVTIYSGPITGSGRIEMLPFLHEQTISMTAHRFGKPDSMMATVEL